MTLCIKSTQEGPILCKYSTTIRMVNQRVYKNVAIIPITSQYLFYKIIFFDFRTKLALPYLKASKKNPHVLNISPPLNMNPRWFRDHVAYTMAKYGMSMCVLGMSEEFKSSHIAVNALWPRTGKNLVILVWGCSFN